MTETLRQWHSERERRSTNQFLEHALVECAFRLSTGRILLCRWQLRTYGNSELYAPETDLVVQFQAIPMLLELLKTVFAHLADTIETNGKEE